MTTNEKRALLTTLHQAERSLAESLAKNLQDTTESILNHATIDEILQYTLLWEEDRKLLRAVNTLKKTFERETKGT